MLFKRRKQKGKEDIQRGKANIQEMLTGGNITSRGNEGINRRSGKRDKGTGTRNRREMRARLCDSAPHTRSHTHHCAQPCPDSLRSLSESFPQGSPLCVADLFHSYKRRTCSHASVQYSTDRQQGSYSDARQTFIKSIQPIYYFCFSPIHTKPTRPAAESRRLIWASGAYLHRQTPDSHTQVNMICLCMTSVLPMSAWHQTIHDMLPVAQVKQVSLSLFVCSCLLHASTS